MQSTEQPRVHPCGHLMPQQDFQSTSCMKLATSRRERDRQCGLHDPFMMLDSRMHCEAKDVGAAHAGRISCETVQISMKPLRTSSKPCSTRIELNMNDSSTDQQISALTLSWPEYYLLLRNLVLPCPTTSPCEMNALCLSRTYTTEITINNVLTVL